MTKTILINKIKKYLERNKFIDKNYTIKDIENIYNAFSDVICDEIEDEVEKLQYTNERNVKINIPLIGRLNIVKQQAYVGRNPKTKNRVYIKECNKAYYSPYKKIKDAINKKRL